MLTWVEIDSSALRRNLQAFRSLAPSGTAIMAVIKANAYGHGLSTVAPIVAGAADWFGVNHVDEALAIRALGITQPIAVLGHTEAERLGDIVGHGLRQVIYRADIAAALSEEARNRNEIARVHLKIETGTNRQGIAAEDLGPLVERIRALPNIEIEGIYTHFANIEDTLDPSFAQRQMDRFRSAVAAMEALGGRPIQTHAAATAGLLLYPEMGFTMARIGIGTYGIWPSRETQLAARERGRQITLSPVLRWKTRIVQLKTVQAGEYVGYGLTYQASRKLSVAVLPVGYYDGYDRRLSNCGRVLVHGHAVPVIGRIAMNMMMLDVTDVGAAVDDEVVLIGRQGSAEIPVEELAEKIGTISYEVVSRINPQIPRITL